VDRRGASAGDATTALLPALVRHVRSMRCRGSGGIAGGSVPPMNGMGFAGGLEAAGERQGRVALSDGFLRLTAWRQPGYELIQRRSKRTCE